MDPNKKPTSQQSQEQASELAGVEIHLFELRFRTTNGAGPDLGIPGLNNPGIVRKREGLTMVYLVRSKLYRISWTGERAATIYVPHEWATFEPDVGQRA